MSPKFLLNFHLETDLDDVLEDDLDDIEDHEKKNIFSNEWTSENTVDAGSKYSERRRFEVAQSRLARAAYNHLRDTELEELDFDSELERVWGTRELKERKFHQALRREQDRDHVCSNCGERGHRPRNCLVPLICSNCGNLGHTSGNCRYQTLRSVDEMVKEDKEREENSKKRKEDHKTLLKKIKIANRGTATRPEVPTTDLDKRNNQLRLELESELDEYANKLERAAERRKEKKKD
ncbi:hypothetical protein BBJ29_009169 [Phytophthora kernoviae]|uniref:CCHC-type domain-containing protein n=1 Tax=Phytophthora kernoviae TaxID=325452 RepID=A0A3F2S1Y5_9STRA|nr:hypothetical protein BBJ29_009169 [Phytophthora kernoviae]RLN68713.1 hypothetical protein BBP00_00000845 [Phytophthora kernoviae]